MYSIFLKNSQGNFIFNNYLLNNDKDIFIKNFLEKMKIVVSDIKMFSYDNQKFEEFMKYKSSKSVRDYLEITNSGTIKKCYKDNEKISGKVLVVLPSDLEGVDYYTTQEILDYNHNKQIDDAWLALNPSTNTQPPNYLGVSYPVLKFKEGIYKNEKSTLIDSIAGVLVDIPARILLEEAAIAAGKTKLD